MRKKWKSQTREGGCWVLLLHVWNRKRHFILYFVRTSFLFFKLILLFIVSPTKKIRKKNAWNDSIGCRFCLFVLHLLVYHFPSDIIACITAVGPTVNSIYLAIAVWIKIISTWLNGLIQSNIPNCQQFLSFDSFPPASNLCINGNQQSPALQFVVFENRSSNSHMSDLASTIKSFSCLFFFLHCRFNYYFLNNIINSQYIWYFKILQWLLSVLQYINIILFTFYVQDSCFQDDKDKMKRIKEIILVYNLNLNYFYLYCQKFVIWCFNVCIF